VGLVLAIDPGGRQGAAIDRVKKEFQGHEVVVVTSGDEALDVIEIQIPDLMMFPLTLAPGDDARLQRRLRDLSNASDLAALTMPLRAFFDGEELTLWPTAAPPRWFYWFRPAEQTSTDSREFAAVVRAAVQPPAKPAPLPIVEPLPVVAPLPAVVPPSAVARLLVLPPVAEVAPVVIVPPVAAAAPVAAALLVAATPPLAAAASAAVVAPDAAVAPVAVATSVVSAEPVVLDRTPRVVAATPAGPAPLAVERVVFIAPEPAADDPWASVSEPAAPALFRSFDEAAEPLEDEGPGRLAQLFASVRTGVAGTARFAWRAGMGLPRPVLVGVPALAIILTLGLTVGSTLAVGERARALGSMPSSWVGALRARWFAARPKMGTAEIQSLPDGAEVWLSGRQIGVTPLKAEFAVGSHDVELRYRGATRTVTLNVEPGATIVERIEWTAPRAMGRLQVTTDPPGADVVIDGTPRGQTPLSADDLAVGRHTVDVTSGGNTVRESVDIRASKTTTLNTSVYRGWLALFSPIDVRATIDGRPLTLDDQNRVLVSAGSHQLAISNRKFGYADTRTIEIKPGETTPFSVVVPKTLLTVTASAPAQVWIDGAPAGDAPVVNHPVDIGTREVLLRSAEHGERHVIVPATVTPVTVAVDFTATEP
jgi:PEGA domain